MNIDKKIEFRGQRYQDTIPDTYDLAERAAMALNAVCNCIDKEKHHWMWFTIHYGKDPSMRHNFSDLDCAGKLLDAMTMLCQMTGDTEHQEIYHNYMKGVFDYVEDDNKLFWAGRLEEDRPWAVTYTFDPLDYDHGEAKEDVARIGMTSKLEQTCLSLYQVSGDPYWLQLAEEIQQAVDKLTIRKEDYAYVPICNSATTLTCGMPRSGEGWFEGEELKCPQEGHEGSGMDQLGFQLQSSAMMYQATGGSLAKDLADRWAKYLMKPWFWGRAPIWGDGSASPGADEPVCIAGFEQGHWHLHYHSTLRALRGILNYGVAMNDSVAVEFARRAFEYGWSMGIPKLGWVTEGPCNSVGGMEGCTIGDLIAYSIRLSDVGAGDYWDQADALVRNMLSETQYTKPELMKKACDNAKTVLPGTQECGRVRSGKEIIDETVGLFLSCLEPDGAEMDLYGANQVMFCCVINCMQGLYYAWEAAVRENGDAATVNLLFNRASKGLDVYSYLPYEGKVEIRNKGKKEISVRIPGWTDKKSVSLKVDGKERTFSMAGQYMILAGLTGTEFIEIGFDVPRYEASYTVYARTPLEKKFTIQFRGSNAVDIAPRDESSTFYPFYTDENLRTATSVPKKEVTRFVPDNELKIW